MLGLEGKILAAVVLGRLRHLVDEKPGDKSHQRLASSLRTLVNHRRRAVSIRPKRPSPVCRTGSPSTRVKPAKRCHVEDRPPLNWAHLLDTNDLYASL